MRMTKIIIAVAMLPLAALAQTSPLPQPPAQQEVVPQPDSSDQAHALMMQLRDTGQILAQTQGLLAQERAANSWALKRITELQAQLKPKTDTPAKQ